MAKEMWQKPIDRTVDWNGCEKTEGLPVSGEFVQKYIRDTLDGKAGYIGLNEFGKVYVVTRDEEAFKNFMANVNETNPKGDKSVEGYIAEFQAPFEYTAAVEVIKPSNGSVTILEGTKGNVIQFKPTTKSSDGTSYDELYSYTVTFRNGNNTQSFNGRTEKLGASVMLNIDEFLLTGDNSVSIVVTGQYTGASAYKSVEFKIIEMSIEDSFDISNVYDLSEQNAQLTVNYKVKSIGQTEIKWFIDGKLIQTTKGSNFNTDNGVMNTMLNKDDDSLGQGLHTLRFYMECNGAFTSEVFRTPVYHRDFFVYRGKDQKVPFVSISASFPYDERTVVDNLPANLYGITQYAPYELPFSVFHKNAESTPVNVYMKMAGDPEYTEVGNYITKNGEVYRHSIIVDEDGAADVKIVAGPTKVEIGPFDVETSHMNLKPVEENLSLFLDAYGRNNSEAQKEVWSFTDQYGDTYSATFHNFVWEEPYGWFNNKLVIGNGMSVTVDMQPFKNASVLDAGVTFEFEFNTINVYDDNAELCRICGPDGAPGIIIRATEAQLVISNAVDTDGYPEAVSTRFKSGENNRISFVITPRGEQSNRGRFVKVYVNGILCGAMTYGYNTSFENDSFIEFKGTSGAEVELSSIRFYRGALNNDQILDNYIFYRKDINEKIALYDKNDIYDVTNQISMDAVKRQLPVMLFKQRMKDGKLEGRIEDIENEYVNKKKTVHFDIEYEDMQNPKFNFTCTRARIRPQGTSSMKYPKKNFRIYTGKEEDTVFKNYKGEVVKKGKYSFKDNAMPVSCWCLKADFAESSSTHNTGVARYWNTIMKDGGLLTKAQKKAKELGLKEDVRTCVDGFPILLFYQEWGGTPRFVGKYNFNNDKSTENVYGFTGGPEQENQDYKYFRVGHDSPIIQIDDGEPCCEMGVWEETPNSASPLYSYKEDPETQKREYYMLRGKELYDNPRMECWEFTDSASQIALFTTTVGFSTNSKAESKTNEFVGRYYNHVDESGTKEVWEGGFESRYPDCGEYYHTSNLRDLCEWIVSTRYLKVDMPTGQSVPMTDEEVQELKRIEDEGNKRPLSQEITIQALTTGDKYKAVEMPDGRVLDFTQPQTLPNTAENRKLKFDIEKWDHFEMDKMAAYYIYLMRFGGVDQTVKNAMFTTEGSDDNEGHPEWPSKWYFINYDNDTIFGVKNDGHLVFDPYITRQSKEGSTDSFVYAGRNSTLWNNLEEDPEFMDLVSKIDGQLHTLHGISYANAIDMFNNQQSAKWCERIYNVDAQCKYIDSYVSPTKEAIDAGRGDENYLYDVQGSRSAHRKWWISKRFNIYDSKFVSGDFLANAIGLKVNNTSRDTNIEVTSGEAIHYGIKGNADALQFITPDVIQPGHVCRLPIPSGTQIGSPLSVLGAPNIEGIDFTDLGTFISELKMGSAYTDALGTKLKFLRMGNHSKPFSNGFESWKGSSISGLDKLEKLEELDITGFRYISLLEGLFNLKNLKTAYLAGTAITGLEFAKGGNIETVYMPETVQSLSLEALQAMQYDGLHFTKYTTDESGIRIENDPDFGSLTRLKIRDCKNLLNDPTFVLNWLEAGKRKNAKWSLYSLDIGDVDWVLNDTKQLEIFKEVLDGGGKLKIRGRIHIDKQLGNDEVSFIQSIFGRRCFDKGYDIRITANMSIYIVGSNNITEGDKASTYDFVLVNVDPDGKYNITLKDNEGSLSDGETIIFKEDEVEHKYATVEVKENNLDLLFLDLMFEYTKGEKVTRDMQRIKVKKRIYPENSKITGPLEMQKTEDYHYSLDLSRNDIAEINGFYDVEWVLSGAASEPEANGRRPLVISEGSNNASGCTLTLNKYFDGYAYLGVNVYRKYDSKKIISSESNQIEIYLTDPSTLFAPTRNTPMYELFKKNGLIPLGKEKFTISDAYTVTEEMLAPGGRSIFRGNTDITSFDEFQYFIKIINIGPDWFNGCTSLSSIIPNDGVLSVGDNAFYRCTSLKSIKMVKLSVLGENAFAYCENLEKAELGPETEVIGKSAFTGCFKLGEFVVPGSLNEIKYDSFNTPFSNCPRIKFKGGNKKFLVDNGNLYMILPELGGKDKKYLVHMACDSLVSTIDSSREIIAMPYSMEYRTEEELIIPENIIFDGYYALNRSRGNTIQFTRTFNGMNCSYILNYSSYRGGYKFAPNETIIPYGCFNYVTEYFDEYTVPEGIEVLKPNAFYGCTNMKKVVLPSTLKTVEKDAFLFCTGLKDIIINSNTVPSINPIEFFNSNINRIYVYPELVEKFRNELNEIYKPFVTPSYLYENGSVRIIENGKIKFADNIDESQVDEILIGGSIVPIKKSNGFLSYTSPMHSNKSLEVVMNGVKIGDVLDENTTIYVGDNSSLFTGEGFDFSIGLYGISSTGNSPIMENNNGWKYDVRFKGIRNNIISGDNQETNISFSIPSLSGSSVDAVMGQYCNKANFAEITNSRGEVLETTLTPGEENIFWNKKYSFPVSDGKLMFTFKHRTVLNTGIDGIVINKIGNVVYSDPSLPDKKARSISRTVSVNVNSISDCIGAPVVVTDNKGTLYRKIWNGETLIFSLTDINDFYIYTEPFINDSGKFIEKTGPSTIYENELSKNIEINCAIQTGVSRNNGITTVLDSESDYYIFEKPFGPSMWSNSNISSIKGIDIFSSPGNGFQNTLTVLENDPENEMFSIASNFTGFGENIKGYIPSYSEIIRIKDRISYLDFDDVWTSDKSSGEFCWTSNGNEVNRKELRRYFIFGKKIK